MNFHNVLSSITEFFTPAEFAQISDYEKVHLSRLRQNYEALKACGFNGTPPEFMLKRRKNKREPVSFSEPIEELDSEDSDEEWTPSCETRRERKDDYVKPFVPRFPTPKKKNDTKVCGGENLSHLTDNNNKSDKKIKEPTRYVLRNNRMVKLMSLQIPDEDDFLYCEECNMEYPGDCPVHGSLLIVEDKDVTDDMRKTENFDFSYATLPDSLEVKMSNIPNAGLGVFAQKHFPMRSRFGPYKGSKEKNEQVAHSSGYCWQIYQDGRPSHFVDARDPCNSNWMRYVNCARSEDEQCLTAYQHEGEIYYRANQDISPGTELLVYYGDSYAEELGIKIQKIDSFSTGERNDDVYPCTVCKLAFSSDVFLEHHLYRIHNTEYWKWKYDASPVRRSTDMRNDSINENESDYKCLICNEAFTEIGSLQIHMIVHTGQKKHQCSECSRVFRQIYCLHRHMRIHTSEKLYKCTVCSKAFNRSDMLHNHMRIHTSEKPYKCTVCSKAFNESGDLHKHMRIHTSEKPYKCTVCSKAFNQSCSLNTHMRIHTDEKPYKFTVCSKAFNRSGSLHTHMRIHTGEKPYKCTVCSKAFNISGNLHTHMRIHTGEKPYKCTVCSKAFNISGSLHRHMRIHTGEKPYKCTVCSKAFNISGHLHTHMRIHTGEKPYKCTVCSKSFIQSCNLHTHMRIHTDEKPYKCTVCSKSFIQSCNLHTHMRIHTGEKPYKCTVCSKAFNRSGHLHRHMRIHTGEKPYKCTVCSKAFNISGHLHRHMRIHTVKKPYK